MASVNSQMVLEFLKRNYGKEFTKQQIVDELGISMPAVVGTINGLLRKGYATERQETHEVEPATETRKAKYKVIRFILLNEAGLTYDPVAEEEAKKAEKKANKG